MTTQVNLYQCPACTGPLRFSAATGKLECEYCGSTYTTEEVEAIFGAKDAAAADAHAAAEAKRAAEPQTDESEWDTSGFTGDWGEAANGMRVFSCPSCGAELICEATTAATSCPYCGNSAIVPGQFRGALKPEFVIPFKIQKEDAIAALKKHYEKKYLLPKLFSSQNQLEKVQGIYVPFWLFDGEAMGNAEFHTTRVHTEKTSSEEITTTDHFVVHRAGTVAFEKVPVDASKKMPDDYMDSIEPFDYGELKDFSTAYLPGYLADKYDVTVEDCRERADTRCRETTETALMDTVNGYDTITTVQQDIKLRRGKVHYALLPVWMLTTKWGGTNYLFAVNGQTGKVAGKLPIDKKKLAATFAAIAVPLGFLIREILLRW